MKITDVKQKVTPEMHGSVMKVGKRNFVRIVIPGMYRWWEAGFQEMRIRDGKPEYRLGANWYEEQV